MPSSIQDAGLAVKRLQWRHHRESNRRLAELGLSLVQWDVLRHLDAEPDASLHRLAELTFQTDQAMGELAKRMIDRDLIERVPGPGRAIRHRLTANGQRLRAAGSGLVDEVLNDTIGRLSTEERTTLHRLLVRAAGTGTGEDEPPSSDA